MITDPTNGSDSAFLNFQIRLAGADTNQLRIGSATGGVYHPSASGNAKGNNTINFGAVYDDNTLLTCMAMSKEFFDTGDINLDKWDAFVPDQEVEEVVAEHPVYVDSDEDELSSKMTNKGIVVRKTGRKKRVPLKEWVPIYDENGRGIDAVLVETYEKVVTPARTVRRQHRTARVFKDMLANGFDPRDPEMFFEKMRKDEALPGMPNQSNWEHNTLCTGEMISHMWLATEMLAIVSNVMWGKLKDLTARVEALENNG